MLASRQVDAGLDQAICEIAMDAEPYRDLLARARHLLPDLGDARLETARIGVRSVAVDGMPVARFAPTVENLYLLASHSGPTLAPVLGELVAGELAGERCEAFELTGRTGSDEEGRAMWMTTSIGGCGMTRSSLGSRRCISTAGSTVSLLLRPTATPVRPASR